ncbi:MAG: hypothetical protein JNG90_19860 [Planctomycetaceae bacterium]|nr:hypothetical protein [Planctomycetaceae bacterium]
MSKHRLPPMGGPSGPLYGPNVESYGVGDWCPTPDGSGPATAVALTFRLESGVDMVFRLKTPESVDFLIQSLLRHKRSVWPESP